MKDQEESTRIEIRCGGHVVTEVSRTYFRIYNGGNRALDSAEFSDLCIRCRDAGLVIIEAEVPRVSDAEMTGFEVNRCGDAAWSIAFRRMRRRDVAEVKVLHSGKPGRLRIDGSSTGDAKLVRTGEFDPADAFGLDRFYRPLATVVASSSGVLGLIIGLENPRFSVLGSIIFGGFCAGVGAGAVVVFLNLAKWVANGLRRLFARLRGWVRAEGREERAIPTQERES